MTMALFDHVSANENIRAVVVDALVIAPERR
jgi:hypothetical protein